MSTCFTRRAVRARTTVNVTGDLAAAVYVARGAPQTEPEAVADG